MNPFTAATESNVETAEESLPEFKEYAFDFIHECFLYDNNGNHKIVIENEALKVWIWKALKTERYRYAAYRHGEYDNVADYGVELEQFIGKNPNNEQTAEQIEEYIRQGLKVNPYITKINSIDIESRSGDSLTLTVDLTSIYGELTQTVTV